MEIRNFKDMYIADLQELASVEAQLAETLPRVAQAASHSALRNALVEHQQKTEVQKGRLDSMLETHGANTTAHTDQAMQALVNETDKMLSMLKGNNLRDAGLIGIHGLHERPARGDR